MSLPLCGRAHGPFLRCLLQVLFEDSNLVRSEVLLMTNNGPIERALLHVSVARWPQCQPMYFAVFFQPNTRKQEEVSTPFVAPSPQPPAACHCSPQMVLPLEAIRLLSCAKKQDFSNILSLHHWFVINVCQAQQQGNWIHFHQSRFQRSSLEIEFGFIVHWKTLLFALELCPEPIFVASL